MAAHLVLVLPDVQVGRTSTAGGSSLRRLPLAHPTPIKDAIDVRVTHGGNAAAAMPRRPCLSQAAATEHLSRSPNRE